MLTDAIQSVPVKRVDRRKPSADGPRRKYTLDFKLKVLEEAMAPGASIAAVALRHNMNTNVVFRWRRLLREGRLTGAAPVSARQLPVPAMVPVRVVPDAPALPAPMTAKPASAPEGGKQAPRPRPGTMTITLPGGFGLRVDPDIEDKTLRRVLRALKDLS